MSAKLTKKYVSSFVTDEEIEQLRAGVTIDECYLTKPARVKILKIDSEKKISRVEIRLNAS